jgi:hypothetical protein
VVAAAGRPVTPGLFPNEVSFTFVHRGKSIVRANGRLYAFDPSDGNREHPLGSGVIWETTASGTSAWGDPTDGISKLDPTALKLTKPGEEGNLISMLLSKSPSDANAADEVTKLSSYRPGAFSDLELIIEFLPTDARIEFTTLVVEVEQELFKRPSEALVSVRNEDDLLIPVSFSRPDLGQFSQGEGLVFAIYDRGELRAQPVRVTLQRQFGARWLKSASIDGKPASLDVANGTLTVSGPCAVIAKFGDADTVSRPPAAPPEPAPMGVA